MKRLYAVGFDVLYQMERFDMTKESGAQRCGIFQIRKRFLWWGFRAAPEVENAEEARSGFGGKNECP